MHKLLLLLLLLLLLFNQMGLFSNISFFHSDLDLWKERGIFKRHHTTSFDTGYAISSV